MERVRSAWNTRSKTFSPSLNSKCFNPSSEAFALSLTKCFVINEPVELVRERYTESSEVVRTGKPSFCERRSTHVIYSKYTEWIFFSRRYRCSVRSYCEGRNTRLTLLDRIGLGSLDLLPRRSQLQHFKHIVNQVIFDGDERVHAELLLDFH